MIRAENIFKIYQLGETEVKAVNGVNLKIEAGEFVSIMGHSGSGKSTLMHILGCLDTPTSGDYFLDNTNTRTLSDEKLSQIRNSKIGFVFQSFNLLSHRDILHNVMLPMIYAGYDENKRKTRSKNVLEALGLGNRLNHKPTELSGGQNQRVAIARSLAVNPEVILADEPTGNLDSKTSMEIMALFAKLNEFGKTVILVTHENDVSEFAHRIIHIKDGKIIKDEKNSNVRIPNVNLEYNLEKIFKGEL